MIQSSSSNPYNDQLQSAGQGQSSSTRSLPSISDRDRSHSRARSTSVNRLREDDDAEGQTNKDTINSSLEIVNIALQNNTLPKVASADEKTMQVIDQNSLHQEQQQKIVIEQDKLLEPSAEVLPEQPVKNTAKKTARNSKQQRKNNLHDLPEFLVQGQELSCKCSVCAKQLDIIKSDGLEPKVQDVLQQKLKHEKMLSKQPKCDQRMKVILAKEKEHQKQIEAGQNGDSTFRRDLLSEIERIKEMGKINFKKGDYFTYEEQTHNWLIQKLAGSQESTYLGCPINITETVIFQNGRGVKVIKTTREDGLVNQIKGATGDLLETRKYLASLCNERNKEYTRKLQQLKFEHAALMKKKALEKAQQKLLQATRGKSGIKALDSTAGLSFKSKIIPTTRSQASKESKEEEQAVIGPQQESQQEMKLKRDAFLLRFKKGSEYRNKPHFKVLQENGLVKELQHRSESDEFLQDLLSISVTPIAKSGFGTFFSFEFIAPCFETNAKSKKQALKNESMSYYGQVHYNFDQFGTDDVLLKKEKPLQYCLKVCHIIGYYVRGVHGFDILKMKVNFNQDQFGEIWLMHVDELFVRKSRQVPTDKGTKVADYVIQKVRAIERAEEQIKLQNERRVKNLSMVQDQAQSLTRHDMLTSMKRAKSIQEQHSVMVSTKNAIVMSRQNDQLRGQFTISPSEVFKRMHPQFFISEVSARGEHDSLIKEMEMPLSSIQKYPQKYIQESQMTQPDKLQMSKASYLNDSDSVHPINQLKELRLSLSKVRKNNNDTNQPPTNFDKQLQRLQNKSISTMQRPSLNHQVSSSYITFLNDRVATSTPNIDYELSKASYNSYAKNAMQASNSRQPERSKQKSVKEVEWLLQDASIPKRDCSQDDQVNKRKAANTLRTECPLLKRENVIKNVKNEAKKYQDYKKKHMFHVRSNHGEASHFSTDSIYVRSAQNYPAKSAYSGKDTAYTSRVRNNQSLLSQHHPTSNARSLRENGFADNGSKRRENMYDSQISVKTDELHRQPQSVNPFASGEALEQFEIKMAKKNQVEAEGDKGSIAQKFRSVDMENPYLREFTRMHANSQRMKEILFEQQVNMQMRCDFLDFEKQEADAQQESIQTLSSSEQKSSKEHPMQKYKQMTDEFFAQEQQKGDKLAADYVRVTAQQPLISLEDQNETAVSTVKRFDQHKQHEYTVEQADSKIISDSKDLTDGLQQLLQPQIPATRLNSTSEEEVTGKNLLKSAGEEASLLNSVTEIQEVLSPERQNDSLFFDGKEHDIYTAQQTGNKRPQPVAEVVTVLGAEDCTGMPHQKARNLAKLIINSKENSAIKQNGLRQIAQNIKSQGRQSVLNQQSASHFMVGTTSFQNDQTSTRYACSRGQTQQQTEVSQRGGNANNGRSIIIGARSTSQKPVYTSYNAWPYAGGRGSTTRRSRDSKPMTNQKARAMVQKDYFLQRQGISLQQLAQKDDQSNLIGRTSALSSENQNNPTISYEAFLNQPTMIHQNMKLGLSRGNISLAGRAVASPFMLPQQIISGSITTNKPRNTSALISGSEVDVTTHYGTFAAKSSTKNGHQSINSKNPRKEGMLDNKTTGNASQSAMYSVNSETLMMMQNPSHAAQAERQEPMSTTKNSKIVVNQSVLQNIQNNSQLSAAINPFATSFLNQTSSSHSTMSLQKEPVRTLQNRGVGQGRYTSLGKIPTSKPSTFFQGL